MILGLLYSCDHFKEPKYGELTYFIKLPDVNGAIEHRQFVCIKCGCAMLCRELTVEILEKAFDNK